jgi:hypothetical protein
MAPTFKIDSMNQQLRIKIKDFIIVNFRSINTINDKDTCYYLDIRGEPTKISNYKT